MGSSCILTIIPDSTNGSLTARSATFGGLGTARAARAAGFEVEHTHPAEHARFEYIGCPTRRAQGNSGPPGYSISLYKQSMQALVKALAV